MKAKPCFLQFRAIATLVSISERFVTDFTVSSRILASFDF